MIGSVGAGCVRAPKLGGGSDSSTSRTASIDVGGDLIESDLAGELFVTSESIENREMGLGAPKLSLLSRSLLPRLV